MPDDVVNFLSLVLIVAALAVSHPVRPEALVAFSERVAYNWTDMQPTGLCDIQEPLSCAQPLTFPNGF